MKSLKEQAVKQFVHMVSGHTERISDRTESGAGIWERSPGHAKTIFGRTEIPRNDVGKAETKAIKTKPRLPRRVSLNILNNTEETPLVVASH